ncbi:MAG: Gfo/Idh/MocA family oxidoreductase, partial [Planctomycetota bacterium]|nr:Gfo/Idh/MocA family oxidoreductase [Planctomycetota bacterium]
MTTHDRRTFLKTAAGTAAAIAIEPQLLAGPRRLAAPIRVGVIGAGRQGRAILGELAKFKEVTIAAIADVDPGRLRSGLRRARGAKGHDAHEKLLDAKGVDAVFIATPTHTHEAVATAALAADAHVYCESPLAHTIESCRSIAKAARGASKVFQTGMQGRANPVYKLARSFVVSGAIRDVVAMRAQYHMKMSWRSPAPDPKFEKARNWKLDPAVSLGLIGEMGTQQFDVMHWFLGRYPVAVTASGDVLAWKDGRKVADTVRCEFRFEDGVQLSYEANIANSYEGQYELLI